MLNFKFLKSNFNSILVIKSYNLLTICDHWSVLLQIMVRATPDAFYSLVWFDQIRIFRHYKNMRIKLQYNLLSYLCILTFGLAFNTITSFTILFVKILLLVGNLLALLLRPIKIQKYLLIYYLCFILRIAVFPNPNIFIWSYWFCLLMY